MFDCGRGRSVSDRDECGPMSQKRDMGHPATSAQDDIFLNESAGLLADADAQGFHFAVEVAAFEAEEFGGVAYVVAGFFYFLEDVFALVSVAGLLQG